MIEKSRYIPEIQVLRLTTEELNIVKRDIEHCLNKELREARARDNKDDPRAKDDYFEPIQQTTLTDGTIKFYILSA